MQNADCTIGYGKHRYRVLSLVPMGKEIKPFEFSNNAEGFRNCGIVFAV